MKNIFISLIATFSVFIASAQVVTPRTGTGANNDNTFRALTQKYVVVTDAAANDTVKLNLNAYQTLVKVNPLVDSVSLNLTPLSNCYFGDKATFLIKSTTGTKVKFITTNVEVGASGLTLTITATKRAIINFIFDGAKWVEVSRMVQ